MRSTWLSSVQLPATTYLLGNWTYLIQNQNRLTKCSVALTNSISARNSGAVTSGRTGMGSFRIIFRNTPKYSVPICKKTHRIFATYIASLKMLRRKITTYFENRMKPINTMCVWNLDLTKCQNHAARLVSTLTYRIKSGWPSCLNGIVVKKNRQHGLQSLLNYNISVHSLVFKAVFLKNLTKNHLFCTY